MNIINSLPEPEIIHYCRIHERYCEYSEIRHNDLYCNHENGPAGILFHIINPLFDLPLHMGTQCPIQQQIAKQEGKNI